MKSKWHMTFHQPLCCSYRSYHLFHLRSGTVLFRSLLLHLSYLHQCLLLELIYFSILYPFWLQNHLAIHIWVLLFAPSLLLKKNSSTLIAPERVVNLGSGLRFRLPLICNPVAMKNKFLWTALKSETITIFFMKRSNFLVLSITFC